jgi:hypothetical protein
MTSPQDNGNFCVRDGVLEIHIEVVAQSSNEGDNLETYGKRFDVKVTLDRFRWDDSLEGEGLTYNENKKHFEGMILSQDLPKITQSETGTMRLIYNPNPVPDEFADQTSQSKDGEIVITKRININSCDSEQ